MTRIRLPHGAQFSTSNSNTIMNYHDNDNDNHFNAVLIMWAIGTAISLTITGLLIWAACHFIAKFW